MDLKEFVEETLTDIFLGVAGAQKRITDIGGEINPAVKTGMNGVVYAPDRQTSHKTLCIAEFDVALTVSDKEQKGGRLASCSGTSERAAASPNPLKRPKSRESSFPSRISCLNSSSG